MTKYQTEAVARAVGASHLKGDALEGALRSIRLFCQRPEFTLENASVVAQSMPALMAEAMIRLGLLDIVCSDPKGEHAALLEEAIGILESRACARFVDAYRAEREEGESR